ncbi:MAG: hypothetical protein FJX77_05965 [Armatimonadetes bacterium]|nr:hypothetical protein [Armatimonadota bacterium]
MEKVLYESRPGFHVSAALYLPDRPGKYPGILFPCGHSENGKAAEAYQRACILLAKNDMVVLCFDPIGQGERKQVLDQAGKSAYRATAEHSMVGIGATLLGRNTASAMVWDGIRSLDYLCSRPEVDPKKIGCTGNSGGGTQTSYLMALDDRIIAAAPGCYLTTFRRLLETIGPQDAEQNIHGQVRQGLDHADYAILHAPQPTLMCVATRDFFDIGGAWQTFRQAKRVYGRLGYPERMELVETDATHGFSRDLRVGATRWMRRWLLGKDDAVTEPDFPIFTDEQLQCTPDGQVLRLPGEKTILEFHREEGRRLAAGRLLGTPAELAATVRMRAGIGDPKALAPPSVQDVGSVGRDGRTVQKLVFSAEEGIRLPALQWEPEGMRTGTVLYLHGEGKGQAAGAAGELNEHLRAGLRVVAVDLRGLGELQARSQQGQPAGTSDRDVTLSYLLGRSLVGQRAEDILRVARWAREATGAGAGPRGLQLVASGEAAIPALHAAAAAPDWFAAVRIRHCLRSWQDVLETSAPTRVRSGVVFGALRSYDLPDLVTALRRASRPIQFLEPVNGEGKPIL